MLVRGALGGQVVHIIYILITMMQTLKCNMTNRSSISIQFKLANWYIHKTDYISHSLQLCTYYIAARNCTCYWVAVADTQRLEHASSYYRDQSFWVELLGPIIFTKCNCFKSRFFSHSQTMNAWGWNWPWMHTSIVLAIYKSNCTNMTCFRLSTINPTPIAHAYYMPFILILGNLTIMTFSSSAVNRWWPQEDC